MLVAVPLLMFGIPALAGHALMPGDDVDQNYPLRVLVGRDLRAGQWPILNPYIWSGAPLLAGWNAGAAYPFTWLFAVLPPVAAWVGNEVFAYATAGLGLYGFCRHARLAPVAALLAALSFALGGTFALQLVHLGLVAGASWIPLILLALARLSEPASRGGRARWVAVLGLAGGLCVLAGEPRAIDTAAVVAGGYTLWRLARTRVRRWGFLAGTLAGGVLAVLLGAVQWAPGLAAVATSQRAAADYALFAGGSLHPSWLSLLAVPMLLGGSGSFGLPGFFATYNLPEVGSYVGLLPLVAAVALLGRLPFRRWWRQRPGASADRAEWPEWLVWHILALVGVVLALGAHTPLGPALHALPLFGDQRLQSRNIMVTDLALAVLLGYWADTWLIRRQRARVSRPERTLAFVPVLGVLVLSVAGIVWGPALAEALGVDAVAAGHADRLWPAFVGSLVLAAVVAAYLWLGPRLRARVRAGVLVALVAVDLAGFLAMAGAPSPVPATSTTVADQPVPSAPFDQIGRDGRFAVYGPDGVGTLRLGGVGITDLNVLSGRYSMQGYTAIVDGRYAEATGTHLPSGGGHNTLSLAALADGRLDQLATGYLLTRSQYLLTDVTEAVGGPGATRAAIPPDDEPGRSLAAGQTATWYFGHPLPVAAVSLPAGTGEPEAGTPRVGLLLPGGSTDWLTTDPVSTDDGGGRATVPAGDRDAARAVGVVVRAVGGPVGKLAGPTVHTRDGAAYLAHGELQDALAGRDWTFTGTLDGYAVFANPHAAAPLSLRALPGRSLAGATVRRASGDRMLPTSAAVSSPNGAVVVRAVAAIPGWTAIWEPADGAARTLPVTRHGLVQAVTVPPGPGVLSWRYHAPGLTLGVVLSTLGLLATAGLLAVSWLGAVRPGSPAGPRRPS